MANPFDISYQEPQALTALFRGFDQAYKEQEQASKLQEIQQLAEQRRLQNERYSQMTPLEVEGKGYSNQQERLKALRDAAMSGVEDINLFARMKRGENLAKVNEQEIADMRSPILRRFAELQLQRALGKQPQQQPIVGGEQLQPIGAIPTESAARQSMVSPNEPLDMTQRNVQSDLAEIDRQLSNKAIPASARAELEAYRQQLVSGQKGVGMDNAPLDPMVTSALSGQQPIQMASAPTSNAQEYENIMRVLMDTPEFRQKLEEKRVASHKGATLANAISAVNTARSMNIPAPAWAVDIYNSGIASGDIQGTMIGSGQGVIEKGQPLKPYSEKTPKPSNDTPEQFTSASGEVYTPKNADEKRLFASMSSDYITPGQINIGRNNAIVTASNELGVSLKNLSILTDKGEKYPSGGAWSGLKNDSLFGATASAVLKPLTQRETLQMEAIVKPIARMLSTVMYGGQGGTQADRDRMEKAIVQEFGTGDKVVALQKLGELRQSATAAIEAQMANQTMTRQQREKLLQNYRAIDAALPYKAEDVLLWQKSGMKEPFRNYIDKQLAIKKYLPE